MAMPYYRYVACSSNSKGEDLGSMEFATKSKHAPLETK